MPGDLPLRCACGALRGVVSGVSAGGGTRLVCYCDDCQAFAHFLEAAPRTLDAHGGTEIFQTSPARVGFRSGLERLACVQLRPGGIVRWYAACCRTPLGNTLATRRVPIVGLIHAGFDAATDARARDDLLGPVRARIYARFARGSEGLDAHAGVPPTLLLRTLRLALRARLRGDATRSPFFAASGAPVVAPRVLGAEELSRVEAARDGA